MKDLSDEIIPLIVGAEYSQQLPFWFPFICLILYNSKGAQHFMKCQVQKIRALMWCLKYGVERRKVQCRSTCSF